jgi:hypothetical protein
MVPSQTAQCALWACWVAGMAGEGLLGGWEGGLLGLIGGYSSPRCIAIQIPIQMCRPCCG